MTNYFFFVSRRETNASGQNRMLLFPLPGQRTLTRPSSEGDVDVTVRAQCSNRDLGRVCRYPEGTVFGIATEGSTRWAARLKTYTRNNAPFYNITEHTPCVMNVTEGVYVAHGDTNRPSQQMTDAYNALTGSTRTAPSGELTRLASFNAEMQLDTDEINRWKQNGITGNLLISMSTLRDRMRQGIVKFSYRKADGSTRDAYGTRCADLLSPIEFANRQENNARGTTFSYFDLQRGEWRCFTLSNLLGVLSMTIEPSASNREIIAAMELQSS